MCVRGEGGVVYVCVGVGVGVCARILFLDFIFAFETFFACWGCLCVLVFCVFCLGAGSVVIRLHQVSTFAFLSACGGGPGGVGEARVSTGASRRVERERIRGAPLSTAASSTFDS